MISADFVAGFVSGALVVAFALLGLYVWCVDRAIRDEARERGEETQ